jgi:hypothetical protein
MTNSAINFNINEQFPTPGVENDSQVFRDNFSTIKTSLASAKTEIEQFLNHGIRDDVEFSDFNGNTITNAVLTKASEKIYDFTALLTAQFDVDFNNGPYQTARVGADVNIQLVNFPSDNTTNGRVTLHLTSNGLHNMVTFISNNGNLIKFDENFPHIDDSTLGDSTLSQSIHPHLGVTSASNPVIVEIWKFKDTFYIKYIGFFS